MAYKYRNWHKSAPNRTGRLAFQKKHWFDKDITVEYLDWLLDVVHPGKKVGLTLDAAPCHRDHLVAEYIKNGQRKDVWSWKR